MHARARDRGDVDHRAFGSLELVEETARQHDRREEIHLKDMVPIVLRSRDRVEPLATFGFRRYRRIVDKGVQLAVETALDLGYRQVGTGEVGEVDLNVVFRASLPWTVFRKGVARAGDHAPTRRGEALDSGVSDASAGAGEKKGSTRTIAQ